MIPMLTLLDKILATVTAGLTLLPRMMALLKEVDAASARHTLLLERLERQQAIQGKDIRNILAALVPGPAASFYFVVTDETGQILFEGESPMEFVMQRHSRRHFKAIAKDADGNVTTLDQADIETRITSANPAVSVENFDADNLEGDLVTGALAGSGPVSLIGDADRDAGEVTELTGVMDILVPAGDAVSVEFELGPEEPVTPPAE